MASNIQIRSGSYQADVTLDGLCGLPLHKVRKLIKIMRGASFENQEALDRLGQHLQVFAEATHRDWEIASLNYRNGWRLGTDLATKKENRRLTIAVKQAKAAYERAMKLKAIFES